MSQEPNGLTQNQQYFGAQTDARIAVSMPNQSNHEDAILHTIRCKNREIQDPQMFKAQYFTGLIQSIQSYHKPNSCTICNQDLSSTNLFITDCHHKNLFCKSCLQQYAIYYVEQLSRVYCPSDKCNREIDMQGEFFKSLPAEVQIKCRNNYQFYSLKTDRELRMCPREDCSGQIKVDKNEKTAKCILCYSEICSKCFLQAHGGECDYLQSQFFQTSLKYRKCPRCNQVINNFESSSNRLICACQYSFCYVCRCDWAAEHQQVHDEMGKVTDIKNGDINGMPQLQVKQKSCRQKAFFVLTLLPRIIISIVIFSLLIALFGLIVVVTILAGCCIMGGSKSRRYQTTANRHQNKEVNSCISGMCGCYFQLLGKVVQALWTC